MNEKQKFTTIQKVVPIMDIEPNDWNPNQQNEKIFESLINSIKENGFTSAILVRTIIPDKKWQIIDGEHRWRACIKLDYSTIKIEDIGIIEEAVAKMLTIALNNIKGQDDVLKRAEILKLLNEGQLSLLPWSKKEMENELSLINFDWNKFNKEEKVEDKKDYTIYFALTKAQYLIVKHALELTKRPHNESILSLVEEYLSLREDITEYKKVLEGDKSI